MSLPNEWERTTRNGAPGYVQIRGGRWEFHRAANGMEGMRLRSTKPTEARDAAHVSRSGVRRAVQVAHEARGATVTNSKNDGRTFTARAVAYDVVDDYGTRFRRGVFNASLEKRLPVIAWAHDWADPVGRVTAWDDRADGLHITATLSDPDAVPRARQAVAQIADGTLTDVSIGFFRRESADAANGVVDITKGDLDEVSLVLRGAVPGSVVTGQRSAPMSPDLDEALRIIQARGSIAPRPIAARGQAPTNDAVTEAIRIATRSGRSA